MYIRVIGQSQTPAAGGLGFTLLWLSPFVSQPPKLVLYEHLNPVEYSIMHVLVY